MNGFISWISALRLRQFLVTLFLGLIFLVGTVFNSAVSEAIAKPLTPEAVSYQVDQDKDESSRSNSFQSARAKTRATIESQRAENKAQEHRNDELARNSKENLKGGVRDVNDSVRNKLNLDEPIYPGTKKFLNDVKERVSNTNLTLGDKK